MRAVLSTLGAFLAAGLRPRTPLGKAIAFVLIIKLLGIAAVRTYMVVGGAEPVIDAQAMARVFGVSPVER